MHFIYSFIHRIHVHLIVTKSDIFAVAQIKYFLLLCKEEKKLIHSDILKLSGLIKIWKYIIVIYIRCLPMRLSCKQTDLVHFKNVTILNLKRVEAAIED